MKIMKTTIVMMLLCAASLYAQQEMTVEDAITIGLKNNFDIQIARHTAEIQENNTGLGTAGFLPTVNASGDLQMLTSDQQTNSPFSFGKSDTRNAGSQIALNWTLFDGFRMFIDNSRYKELAKLGKFQSKNSIENTVVEILRDYFNLVQQEQLLDVAKNTREVSETRLSKERVRNELGAASSTDLLNAQVSFNNDEADVLNQELQVLIAAKDLNILLGRDPSTPVSVKKEIIIPPFEMDLEELIRLAEERNSILTVARQNKIVADHNAQLASAFFYPTITLNATYGYADRLVSSSSDRFPDDINTKSTDGVIGLTLSYNLFNGNRDRINLQNARIEARNRELELQDSRNQLAGLVREKLVTFQKRMELVRLEQQNVVAAEQNLELQQDRFQIGATSSLEFRDAQVNLSRAQTTLIVARYQARITALEIQQLTGELNVD